MRIGYSLTQWQRILEDFNIVFLDECANYDLLRVTVLFDYF